MPEKKKRGRPEFVLSQKDIDQLIAMMRIQCTMAEICGVFQVTDKTLNEALVKADLPIFSVLYKRHQSEGHASLRRAQWKLATENLNPTMLIWLGKQNLGQKDQVETTNIHELKPFDGWHIERARKPD